MGHSTEALITEICTDHKLFHVGLASAELSASEMSSNYKKWIDAGFHGEMSYLSAHSALKYHPQKLLPGAQSLIQVVLPYYRPMHYESLPPGWGRVARYAWGRDYHKVLKKRLSVVCRDLKNEFPMEDFRPFVDSGPLDERYYSLQADLGGIGRNGLLIHPRFGSWIFLGEVLSTLHVDVTTQKKSFDKGAICPPACNNCRLKCPTGALRSDGTFDARLCISYLTIEYRGVIDLDLRPLIGDRLFGCDVCQEVCPLNRTPVETTEPDFLGDIAGEAVNLAKVIEVRTHEEMVKLFAGSPVMRLNVEQLLRNVVIVAANTGAYELLPEIKKLTTHEKPVVKTHAEWAVSQLI